MIGDAYLLSAHRHYLDTAIPQRNRELENFAFWHDESGLGSDKITYLSR